MKVHHLNCGTMKTPSPMVCHVLLVETDAGLVLVDSGYGTHDCDNPRRVGPARRMVSAALRHDETVAHQIDRLGFKRDDVRHIVITHMDVDHAGGISDFPAAQIHLTAAEALGAIWAPSRREKVRYRSGQWAHNPNIVEHDPRGEMWRGFAAAKELTEISPGIALVSLPGHSRGHACVAVDAGHRWVLHAGDAFYHYGTLERTPVPRGLTAMESMVAFDRKLVQSNHARLAELHQRQERDLMVVCAHDPTLLERARATA